MPHFAGPNFPTGFGPVASISKTSLTTPTGAGATVGSTEGTDLLTALLSTRDALGAGLYRIHVLALVRTQSDAATSDAVIPVFTYTDDRGAQTAITPTNPATSLDAKAAVGTSHSWSHLARVASGTLAVAIRSTVTGAKTAGAIDWYCVIEKVG